MSANGTEQAATLERPTGCEITIVRATREQGVDVRALARFLRPLIAELAPDAISFAVRLVGDRTMQRINREFRGKDQPTDVLSFPGEVTPEGRHLGDVAIAVPTARRQAEAAGHALGRELEILLLHGVLHCLGHDHETDGGAMERLERSLRRRYLTPYSDA